MYNMNTVDGRGDKYRILVADDEPAGMNHVCAIIEKKCPRYKITGRAENGQDALSLIRHNPPDIVITDVRMPVMDGIRLVTQMKQEYPEISAVIVSGYSEFDYVKGALKSGVCDYLLKPLVPLDLVRLLGQLEIKLKKQYYMKRNQILKTLCCGMDLGSGEVSHYFPDGGYYCALFRKNGLPGRFSKFKGIEIFSMEEEQVYIYGRDEMEAIYLIPERLLLRDSFTEAAEKIFRRENSGAAYVTGIVCPEAFSLEEFPRMAKKLYRKLDETIVTGHSRLVLLDGSKKTSGRNGEEKEKYEQLEQLVRFGKYDRILKAFSEMLCIWEKNQYPQIHVEVRVRALFSTLLSLYQPELNVADAAYALEEIFLCALDANDFSDSIKALLGQYFPKGDKDQNPDPEDHKEHIYKEIRSFVYAHMAEPMTLHSICRIFGISQTTLSKMFRVYENTSFAAYMTRVRIEKAKELMKLAPPMLIKDIAERVGYADQFYFSRIFRSVTGVCPREYMEPLWKDGQNHKKKGAENDTTG